MKKQIHIVAMIVLMAMVGCRQDVVIYPSETEQVGEPQTHGLLGMYLLNEGNMGSNKATLDYYDMVTATYVRNMYAFMNPTVPKELGDVGNDLKIYGGKLYAVVNVSNKIEVMTAGNCVRLGQIDVPNCRYLRFDGRYGYVTSYAGPVKIDPEYTQRGYVAKFDTATLRIVDTCLVGFQPDELEIVGDKMYVANSGGYMVPNYENTVSVIDMHTFAEVGRIKVARNLHHLRADQYGGLWVTSRGDYYQEPSRLYYIDTERDEVTDSVMTGVSNMCLAGDSLYLYSTEYNNETYTTRVQYGIVDVRTRKLVSESFITDGTEKDIRVPYGLAVNPYTGEIYVTDARNYVTPGYLHCYSRDGKHQWKVRTGDIPAHFALHFR